jgi:hypothetical protein
MQLFFDPIKLGEFSTQFFFHTIDKLGKEKDCCKLVLRLQLPKLMSFFLYQFFMNYYVPIYASYSYK